MVLNGLKRLEMHFKHNSTCYLFFFESVENDLDRTLDIFHCNHNQSIRMDKYTFVVIFQCEKVQTLKTRKITVSSSLVNNCTESEYDV